MTKEEKKTFVKGLVNDVAQALILQIENGDIPEEWDGHELRALLATKFMRERSAFIDDTKSDRYRNFIRTVAQKGL